MAKTPWLDPDQPLEQRVRDLMGRMTLEEKISQMVYDRRPSPASGSRNTTGGTRASTVWAGRALPPFFRRPSGWRRLLIRSSWGGSRLRFPTRRAQSTTSSPRQGYRRQYHGLTLWSPNVNIFRDPRWGRGQETYGEDPFLGGRMGVAFVKGIQGDDPRYVKLAATPKHFAVHSGPEALRHHFDARASARDLRETYLPAFRDCVVEGGSRICDGRVQPDQRRALLRQPDAPGPDI